MIDFYIEIYIIVKRKTQKNKKYERNFRKQKEKHPQLGSFVFNRKNSPTLAVVGQMYINYKALAL